MSLFLMASRVSRSRSLERKVRGLRRALLRGVHGAEIERIDADFSHSSSTTVSAAIAALVAPGAR